MANLIQELESRKAIQPPSWVGPNVHYLTLMGSVAYGVSSDTSDMDVYGFCIPPKETIFPHLAGEIEGFGRQKERFKQFQVAHVQDNGRTYDLSVYNIVRFFHLCMENNPNMIDSLYTPQNCILHSTSVGNMVRDNRRMFLHKGAWHKFKGYSYSQLHKISEPSREAVRRFEAEYSIPHTNKLRKRMDAIYEYWQEETCGDDELDAVFAKWNNMLAPCGEGGHYSNILERYYKLLEKGDAVPVGKRKPLVEEWGFDVKFAYHVVRLLYEVEQILSIADIDLQLHKEHLKAVRRGEVSEADIRTWASEKEKSLERLYETSTLPYAPDEQRIKKLLLECLEAHYGNLSDAVVNPSLAVTVIDEIQESLNKFYKSGAKG